MKSIGNRLKNFRKQKNMTQQQMAVKTNLSRSYISDLENDRKSPTFKSVEKILNTFDADISDLYKKGE